MSFYEQRLPAATKRVVGLEDGMLPSSKVLCYIPISQIRSPIELLRRQDSLTSHIRCYTA